MPPIAVQTLTAEVAAQLREMARALPYRAAIGVDPERIVWIDVAGRERIGVAYTPDDPDGAHWMIALSRLDGSPMTRRAIRTLVERVIGHAVSVEIAPPLDGAPRLTLVRVRAE
ncbi:MAG: hypothetical protein ACRD1H_01045 [Vicinamibacterales bacterium]